MEYMRVIKNSEEIQDVFELPQQWKNRKVEILIFPYADSMGSNIEELGGVLSRYQREEKQILEKEAWAKAVKEKYGARRCECHIAIFFACSRRTLSFVQRIYEK